MKVSTILPMMLLTMLGCSNTPSDVIPTKGILTCTIDGKSFSAKIARATIENVLSDGILDVLGINDADIVELIFLDKEVKSNTSITSEGGVSINGNNYVILPEKQAVVLINTRTSTNVKGTFSFTAVNDLISPTSTVTVTDGKFDVPIE